MITSTDLIHLPYSPDLTQAGIAFACRSLASFSGSLGSSPVNNLRCIVADVAGGLALRRRLSEQSIPFGVQGVAPFSQPEHYNLSLGGHTCILKCYLITRRIQITSIRKDPAVLLQTSAILPIEQFAAEGHKPDDIYIFAFILGVVAANRGEINSACAVGQPTCLIHRLPAEWALPVLWLPLERLVLKSESASPVTIEIGGKGAGHEFITARMVLPPRQHVPVEQCFYSLAYIQVMSQPEARIGLHSSTRGKAYIIPAHGWSNLWVYGMDIFLAGWLCHEEYQRKAKVMNIGMYTVQFGRTREKNLFVPLVELKPLNPLLVDIKEWEKGRGSPVNAKPFESSRS
jgi:hypothetical protein